MNAMEAIGKYNRITLDTGTKDFCYAGLKDDILYWYPDIQSKILPVSMKSLFGNNWIEYKPKEQKDNKQHKFSYILYDTVNISSEYRKHNYNIDFFSIVKGQSDVIVNIDDTTNYHYKTMLDTNICSAKAVGCDFVFGGISILAKNVNQLQYNLLQENCMIEVCINDYAFDFPLSFIPFAINKDTEQNVKFLPVGGTLITGKDTFYPRI